VMEGSRPICVEVQALVVPSHAPIPRRVAQSIDASRVSMLTAVVQQHAGLELSSFDVFVSVAGGVRVAEPSGDLAFALALAGARSERAVDPNTVVIGELGLGGEVRQVPHAPRRLAEALRLGFTRAVVPTSTPEVRGLDVVRVGTVREALVATGVRAR